MILDERMEAMSVTVGMVNLCPNCGYMNVHGWTWNGALDPYPEHGNIQIESPGVMLALTALASERGTLIYLECLPSCPERV